MQYFECTLTQVLCCTAGLTSFCTPKLQRAPGLGAHPLQPQPSATSRAAPGALHCLLAEQEQASRAAESQVQREKPPTKLWLPCSSGDVPGCPSLVRLLPGRSRALLVCPGCRVWGGIPACFNQPLKAPACNKLLMPAFCSSITLKLLGTKLLMYLPEFMQIY